jgi:hypothetical protein
MDALPDVIQLQHETKRKAQGLDKMINPPIVADIQLEHRPTALMPNGITFVAGNNNVGAKPLYQIQAPLQEMTEDIRDIQLRIRETLHNNLFNMISNSTPCVAPPRLTLGARRSSSCSGACSTASRAKPSAPPSIASTRSWNGRVCCPSRRPEIEGADIQVQYVSILSTAQSAVAAAPVERWVGLIGNLAGVVPEACRSLTGPSWSATTAPRSVSRLVI